MDTLNYLAYGSNLWPPRLAARVSVLASLGKVALPGQTLAFTKRGADGSGKCHLASAAAATAWGVVYRIPAQDKPVLDRIEGVGHGYAVAQVEVAAHGLCFVYQALATALDPRLRPFDWYRAYVLAGARHHGLPSDYIEAIASTPTVSDTDAARDAQNRACLAQVATV
ncbi:MAG: gamma-glutamylcyclotransferase family protein [Gammaproteobacteria bacterium]